MNASQSTMSQAPSFGQWETVRFLILKLWFEDGKTLPSIIHHLREHGLHVSKKTLNAKLQEWGLIKKMNPKDAEDLLAAQAHLDALGQTGLLLLRGRLQHMKRVRDYRSRRNKSLDHQTIKSDTTKIAAPSQVITLLCHPHLRPEPALALLTKFESLLREMQILLHACKETSMCTPGRTTLDWKTSTIKSELLETSLQYSTWEGARAFEEGSFAWAGLCWQSALLTLEDLIWEPDLNIWICFIRCCVRLARFRAEKVAEQFLWKLRWLRDKLPFSAPHRAFINALADLSLSDLVNGCLFTLEANLRNIELLWPLERDCHVEYHLHLQEERIYQGLDTATHVVPQVHNSGLPSGQDLWLNTCIQRSQISACMLQSEYSKAESIASSNISQLEQQQESNTDNQRGDMISALLAKWYLALGTIQYYVFDNVQSRTSYLKCLQHHQDTKGFQPELTLQPEQIHRILTLLDWLNATTLPSQEQIVFDLNVYKQKLEMDLDTHLQVRENASFPQPSAATLRFPMEAQMNKRKYPNKYGDTRSIPERPRVVQRPMLFSVDRDKGKASDALEVTTLEKEIPKHSRQGSVKAHQLPAKESLSSATDRVRGGTGDEKKGGEEQAATKGKGGRTGNGTAAKSDSRARPAVPWG